MMSAIVLLSPAICRGIKLEACLACVCNPSMRGRHPATTDLDVLNVCVHDTAEVLSQNVPI